MRGFASGRGRRPPLRSRGFGVVWERALESLRPIREWRNVDAAVFREQIAPLNAPAVLKGFVRDWPAVQAGLQSPAAFWDYTKRFDSGRAVETSIGPPAIKGRFFYRDDMRGFNFEHRKEPVATAMRRLLSGLNNPDLPAIYIQAAALADCLPGFADENILPVPTSAQPRIWIGNAVIVAAHYDLSENIACVVCGRRRFTLFPPEQIRNLYVGPFDLTPAGTPISMVSLEEPDLQRFPHFAEALSAAETADLDAGDALYIPYFWWHHVKSLEPFNVLVNYWWNDARAVVSPYQSLLLALLALKDLPADQRKAWREVFDHYVFQLHGDPVAHIPPENRGPLGKLTLEQAVRLRTSLGESLKK